MWSVEINEESYLKLPKDHWTTRHIRSIENCCSVMMMMMIIGISPDIYEDKELSSLKGNSVIFHYPPYLWRCLER